jgi:hypothetical protein
MDKRFRLIAVLVLVLLCLAAAAPAPLHAACNFACTALCDDAFDQCIDDCGPITRGDPCATGCRNAKVSCYSGCCA